MKRLLAADISSIYCLGKAFRFGELGERHYPEFTLLEWYRPSWDEHELMDEVFNLLVEVGVENVGEEGVSQGYIKKTYAEVFESEAGINPHLGEISSLRDLAGKLASRDFSGEDRATCLDLIFSLQIEPVLPSGVVFIHDYPACQAALAEIGVAGTTEDGAVVTVARRFEVFIDGIELANGYYELTDAAELRQRFEEDNKKRLQTGKLTVDPDERLLAAMTAGLPPCAGVALGVDRLLMNLLGAKNIAEVLPFADLCLEG
jgi:elongation factor P--(R)-beta-lysine ligase